MLIVAISAFVSPVAEAVVCCTTCTNPTTGKAECNRFGLTENLGDIIPGEFGTVDYCRQRGYPNYKEEDGECGVTKGNCDAEGCEA